LPDRNDPVVVAMAADDAMLALATQGISTLRIYSWDGPQLSLGYFQSESIRIPMGHSPTDGFRPWARRSTGGEALLHHHEWTYAFALPPGHPLARQASNLPNLVHEAISRGLTNLGYSASLHEGADLYVDRSGLCFQHFTPGDLLDCFSKKARSNPDFPDWRIFNQAFPFPQARTLPVGSPP
jgi:lipoate-protein ligase A